MVLERIALKPSPESIASLPYDCIWVRLGERKSPRPLTSALLQQLDWKLQGQISRYLAEGREKSGVTFVATMGRLQSPYLALDCSENTDWGVFVRSCDGMKLKRVLYVVDGPLIPGQAEQGLRSQPPKAYPESVALGVEETAGDP